VDLAGRAESLGYESLWVTHGIGRDSFLVLSSYAVATRRIGLGNGVVPIYPRHPAVMAQEALTLAELSAGRFRLGIGVSHKATMEAMHGLSLADPLGRMREYVAVLRGALTDGVAFEGRHYRVHWRAALPTLPPAPPILIAALSTRMLELAGEIADGAVLWLCTPRYIAETALPAIERGRRRAGKTLDGFEIVAAVPLAITEEPGAAQQAFREELVRYLMLPFYRAMLGASGFRDDLARFDRDGGVPDRLTGALGGIGHRKTAQAYLAAYRDAGVTLPAVRPITFPDAPWYRRTLEDALA
jgi:alkanesulfonate monooxygenase SsuD/methylene tetrahydromethanopterin reductase-like flavin-dependent oxidoreductase (luciferase family)